MSTTFHDKWESLVSRAAKTIQLSDPSITYDDLQQEMFLFLLSDYGVAVSVIAERKRDPMRYMEMILKNHIRDLLTAQNPPPRKYGDHQYSYTASAVRRILPLALDPEALTGAGVNEDDGVRVSGTHDPKAVQEITASVVDIRVAIDKAPRWVGQTLEHYNEHGVTTKNGIETVNAALKEVARIANRKGL